MAKGENLEKPKKGGMVIVIGVGKPTKPKKGDLKKSGPRRRGGGAASNRSRKVQMKERMDEDPNYLQRQFERFNVNEDFMNKYFEHHHGKSLDEAIGDESINIIESMKRARKMKAANEGHDPKNAGLQRLLRNRGVSFSQLRQSLDEDPFMEWSDRIDSLTDNDHVEEQRNRRRGEGRGFTPTQEGRPSSHDGGGGGDRREQLRGMGLNEYEVNHQMMQDEQDEQDLRFQQQRLQEMRDAKQNFRQRRTKSAQMRDEEGEINYNRVARAGSKLISAKRALKLYDKKAKDLREKFNFDDLADNQKKHAASKDKRIKEIMTLLSTQKTPATKQIAQEMLEEAHKDFYVKRMMSLLGYDDRDVIQSRAQRTDYDDATAGQFGNMSEQEKGDYYEFLERLYSADTRLNPEVQAMRHLGMSDDATSKPKFPLYRVRGSVRATPSTVFNPETPKSFLPLPTPQEEDEEEANKYAKGNPMSMAWALLKGNRSMRDAEGRAINHPAAMVYDDLAAQIHLNEQNPFDERLGNEDDESAADRMEEMRNPTHQRKVMRRIKEGKPASFLDAKMAMRNDQAEQNRLRQYREEAREQTRNTMDFGNEDDSPSPNYGMQRQREADTDVRMKEGNIMDYV